ncbi:unnamed protein product [Sphagnum balticum]
MRQTTKLQQEEIINSKPTTREGTRATHPNSTETFRMASAAIASFLVKPFSGRKMSPSKRNKLAKRSHSTQPDGIAIGDENLAIINANIEKELYGDECVRVSKRMRASRRTLFEILMQDMCIKMREEKMRVIKWEVPVAEEIENKEESAKIQTWFAKNDEYWKMREEKSRLACTQQKLDAIRLRYLLTEELKKREESETVQMFARVDGYNEMREEKSRLACTREKLESIHLRALVLEQLKKEEEAKLASEKEEMETVQMFAKVEEYKRIREEKSRLACAQETIDEIYVEHIFLRAEELARKVADELERSLEQDWLNYEQARYVQEEHERLSLDWSVVSRNPKFKGKIQILSQERVEESYEHVLLVQKEERKLAHQWRINNLIEIGMKYRRN